MLLLSFTVKNHKSIRDELILDLTRPSLRTLQPAEGSRWVDHIYPLAGVFGANASGKSAILDAMSYAFAAIRHSATTWQDHGSMRRSPFLLDDHSGNESSIYEFDFVHDERRYVYGFEVTGSGIAKEWLRDVPNSRWRILIERDSSIGIPKVHKELRGVGPVAPRELMLSRALLLEDSALKMIARDLVDSFDSMSVKDTHRERRLASITESLANGSIDFDDIVTLLQVADIGVEHVEVQEDALPLEVQELLKGMNALFHEKINRDKEDSDVSKQSGRVHIELGVESSDAVVRNLMFTHKGVGRDVASFRIHDESDGTIAWLALVVPALEILRCGGLYCVDEIDSSLHPHLVQTLLAMFADLTINTMGAQLVFTSHESYILSPLSDVTLTPEQVWFTDKTNEGVTELTSLADFPRNRDANVAKRYLEGRYGGVPRLAPSAIGRLLAPKVV